MEGFCLGLLPPKSIKIAWSGLVEWQVQVHHRNLSKIAMCLCIYTNTLFVVLLHSTWAAWSTKIATWCKCGKNHLCRNKLPICLCLHLEPCCATQK